jgi:AcrR family transcriptional regulator
MKPKRMTRSEQQAQTRERLLLAAEAVLAEQGYAGASIDLISAEAGYSKGAVYSNFESKEAVFLELVRVYMQRGLADLETLVENLSVDPAAALSQWLSGLQVDNSCLMLTTEMQLQARRSKAFGERYYALQRQQTRALAKLLERHQASAGRSLPMDALDLADAMLAMAHGITLHHPVGKGSKASPAGRIMERILELLGR